MEAESAHRFNCDVCFKSFMHRKNMMRHRALHSDVRAFECRLCHSTFQRKDHLEDHWFCHVKGRSLDCPVLQCNFICDNASFLRAHIMSEHKIAVKNPSICKHCNKLFRSCRSLMVHYHTGDLFPNEYEGVYSRMDYKDNAAESVQDGAASLKQLIDTVMSDEPTKPNETSNNCHESASLPQSVLDYVQKFCNLDNFTSFGANIKTEELTELQAEHPSTADAEEADFPSPFPSVSSPGSPIESILAEHSYCASYTEPPPKKAASTTESIITLNSSEDPSRAGSITPTSDRIEEQENSFNLASTEVSLTPTSKVLVAQEKSLDGCTSERSDDTIALGTSAHSPVRCEADKEEKLHCSICKITYDDEAMFIMHTGFHSLGDPFRCNICGYKCESRFEFNGHLMFGSHHPRTST